MKKLLLSAVICSATVTFAQNVAINSTGAAPVSSAALDVDMTNKGILVPRVALTATNAFAPVTGTATASLLVYNTATAGAGSTAVAPGYYYWDGARWVRFLGSGNAWLVGGNYNGATGSFGTMDNNHIDLVSNGVVRGRLSNLGEFFIGTTATALTGDLMNGVSNAAFPWAINGYSSENGSGVYGAVLAGTTFFAGVQGEHYGTSANGAGVRGIDGSATAGTSFASVRAGVSGDVSAVGGSYKFGVFGSGGASTRTGGVMGYDYGVAMGALGYYANNGNDYAVYGFSMGHTNGLAGGKGASSNAKPTEANANIGLGIYGGAMGGWIRGEVLGTHVKGEVYSMYVDGKTYTNAPITQLVGTEGDRQPVYASSAMKVDVTERGKANLNAGTVYVPFDEAFKKTISQNPDELTITVTPVGNSNGIYILNYDSNGFTVKENNNGTSNVAFNWIAIGTQRNYETVDHDPMVLSGDFDQKMNALMVTDQDEDAAPQYMWWDGTQMRFDTPPPAKSTMPGYTPLTGTERPKSVSNTMNQSGSETE